MRMSLNGFEPPGIEGRSRSSVLMNSNISDANKLHKVKKEEASLTYNPPH